jgi:hypothetical protein
MKKHFNGRDFQLWEYNVSHGQMLVRSPKSPTQSVNVDITFSGVEYVDLPRHLRGREIDDPTAAEVACAAKRLGKPIKAKEVTVLKAGSNRYLIVATFIKVTESEMEMFDSPFH